MMKAICFLLLVALNPVSVFADEKREVKVYVVESRARLEPKYDEHTGQKKIMDTPDDYSEAMVSDEWIATSIEVHPAHKERLVLTLRSGTKEARGEISFQRFFEKNPYDKQVKESPGPKTIALLTQLLQADSGVHLIIRGRFNESGDLVLLGTKEFVAPEVALVSAREGGRIYYLEDYGVAKYNQGYAIKFLQDLQRRLLPEKSAQQKAVDEASRVAIEAIKQVQANNFQITPEWLAETAETFKREAERIKGEQEAAEAGAVEEVGK